MCGSANAADGSVNFEKMDEKNKNGIDILEDQTFVHLVRRSGLHQVAAAGQTGAGRKAKEYVSEFFHRSLEF